MDTFNDYYDSSGLELHITVVALPSNKTNVVVSTGHWFRVNYFQNIKSPEDCWEILFKISKQIGRQYKKCSKNATSVYIDKLNKIQTHEIIEIIKDNIGGDTYNVWELSSSE